MALNNRAWEMALIIRGALFFKPHFPLILTFPRDWGQADLSASPPEGRAIPIKTKGRAQREYILFSIS